MAYEPPKDYIDVAERIREFREKHPDGSLQQVNWEVIQVGEKHFVAYTAAAYRTPDDERPGIGTAWEPFPGPTPYTRDSELMNAETSAWGRAIIAAGAADAKRVASANEVANRQATPARAPVNNTPTQDPGVAAVAAAFGAKPAEAAGDDFTFNFGKHKGVHLRDVDASYLDWLLRQPSKPGYEDKTAAAHAMYRRELARRDAVAA